MVAPIAILGTGKMGSALAQRLADLEPSLWNRNPSRAERVGVGRVAATPAAAVRGAEIVILSLTGADAVRAALGGPEGALAAASGQLFIEMSMAGPGCWRSSSRRSSRPARRSSTRPSWAPPSPCSAGRPRSWSAAPPPDVERAQTSPGAVGRGASRRPPGQWSAPQAGGQRHARHDHRGRRRAADRRRGRRARPRGGPLGAGPARAVARDAPDRIPAPPPRTNPLRGARLLKDLDLAMELSNGRRHGLL